MRADTRFPRVRQHDRPIFDSRTVAIPLLSPPRAPRYNGTVEAGFGSLRTRVYYKAARQGRVGYWTSDDLEAAHGLSNCAVPPEPVPCERRVSMTAWHSTPSAQQRRLGVAPNPETLLGRAPAGGSLPEGTPEIEFPVIRGRL